MREGGREGGNGRKELGERGRQYGRREEGGKKEGGRGMKEGRERRSGGGRREIRRGE